MLQIPISSRWPDLARASCRFKLSCQEPITKMAINIANQTPSQMIYGGKTLSFIQPLSNRPGSKKHRGAGRRPESGKPVGPRRPPPGLIHMNRLALQGVLDFRQGLIDAEEDDQHLTIEPDGQGPE